MSLLANYLPPQLPASGEVARWSEDAADALREFEQYEATLPSRRSDEERNELDRLRGLALQRLGDDFTAARAKATTARRAALRKHVDALQQLWSEEEVDRGFDLYQSRGGQSAYMPTRVPLLVVRLGNGLTKVIMAREVLTALSQEIGA